MVNNINNYTICMERIIVISDVYKIDIIYITGFSSFPITEKVCCYMLPEIKLIGYFLEYLLRMIKIYFLFCLLSKMLS